MSPLGRDSNAKLLCLRIDSVVDGVGRAIKIIAGCHGQRIYSTNANSDYQREYDCVLNGRGTVFVL